MKRTPSVDRIEEGCGMPREDAIKIRRLLDGRDQPEKYEAGRKRVAECFHRPDDVDLIMTVVDSILGTYGVEAIRCQTEWDRYYGSTVAMYCNTGDSYNATVLYDVDRAVFYVTTTGDWQDTAERNRRYKF